MFRRGYKITLNRVHDRITVREGTEELTLAVTKRPVTLTAAKAMDYKRVIAVFQPLTYSRTAMLLGEFAEALSIADGIVMTQIMGSRERNTYGVHTSQLAAKIPGSVWFETFEEVADYVVRTAEPGDLVITLGCGDIYKAAKLMIQKYNAMEDETCATP